MIRAGILAGAIASVFALAAPAAAQSFVVTNATVATGDGSEPIENGHVVVRDGQVAEVGSGAAPAGYPAIDAGGGWVTPGLVATVTSLGLWDVGAVGESNDTRAGRSPFSAALDVAPAINPNSQHVMIHRAAGITRAATVTMPSSSIFGGQGAIIDLGADGEPVTRARAFQIVALGESGARLAGGSRASAHALFRNALREADRFGRDARIPGRQSRPAESDTGDDMPLDPRLAAGNAERGDDVLLTRFDAAALVPVVRGEQRLYVEVERASDIRSVLDLKREFPRLDIVLVGASEGWLVADEIAAAGVSVIADGLDDLPERFEELASTQSNIGRMARAGVKVAINASAMENPRNLNQFAGNLVALTRVPRAAGLSWGQALAAITSVPAEISGLGGRAGVLAPGAAGDLVIWDNDPLEVGSMPVRVFIDGVEQPLDNHQSRLKERYRDLDESRLPKAYDW
ncbi:amidohydrolase family protein [Pelagerythrobacter marinus]|uniref:amidohydrolase family protein n=1 Tax=Pelagerythrobacter marinus TaxID=538382 RepID=UPI002037308F|nr:amidohydrolase family protein [Pelagerythrobacter marinus]USA39229.1 amidohydrolase family protein [Pelagerythrobacter marinus]WPZ06684.1 amidohydrolase family protein [Pelagerythrobacter marinus]